MAGHRENRTREKGRARIMGKDGESIPDEEWERFLREAEAGTPGAPEEPSARARMAARRLPEGETSGPVAWRAHQPARRRRGNGRYLAGLLIAVGLFVVALRPGPLAGWFGGGDESGGRAPLAAESERPDQPPPMRGAALLPTLEQPFKGSPAERWGDGTAGISLPAARATGWMSKEQVAQTLNRSRDFLAGSSLDPGVLRGERPAEAIALTNPHQPDVQDYLAAAFRAPSRENDPRLLFSRFANKDVRLVGNVVRTRGRITYREGKRGAVEVTSDVTFVYPVVRAAAGSDEVVRTIVRREIVMSWDNPAKVITEPGTFSLISYRADISNGGCDTYSGYFSPEFKAERDPRGTGDGPEVDPYDRSTSMDARMRESGKDECGIASRS